MVPVDTIASTLTLELYEQHVYIASIYEILFVVAAFFLLLCQYLHADVKSLRNMFAMVSPKPWLYPLAS